MRAVLARDGQPVIVDIPAPTPGPDDLLVAVSATALNRADLLQVQGAYPPPRGAPETLGLELAGRVLQAGDNVHDFRPGQRVMALLAGGGYAERAVFPAAHAMPVPDHLSDTEAAAIPEAFLTAYSNMLQIGQLRAGQTVLIHAGASGVGLAACQMARLLGARVCVTASAGKHDTCREHGAEICIDYHTEDFAQVLTDAGIQVNLVLDMVGGSYWQGNLRIIKRWGRVVYIGLMGGRTVDMDLGQIMARRLTVTGSTLRDRTTEEKAALVHEFWEWAGPHFVSGALRPTVWRVLPLEQVAQAHQLMRENASAGKIVLTL